MDDIIGVESAIHLPVSLDMPLKDIHDDLFIVKRKSDLPHSVYFKFF